MSWQCNNAITWLVVDNGNPICTLLLQQKSKGTIYSNKNHRVKQSYNRFNLLSCFRRLYFELRLSLLYLEEFRVQKLEKYTNTETKILMSWSKNSEKNTIHKSSIQWQLLKEWYRIYFLECDVWQKIVCKYKYLHMAISNGKKNR